MFETFAARFRAVPADQVAGWMWGDDRLLLTAGYSELAGMYAGVSFENGLCRLHDAETGPEVRR
jgi:hypothetical protein